MARKKKNPILEVTNLGPIKKAKVEFGDLTVLVGPQASGKSIFLQTLKLAVDSEAVAVMLRKQGYDWGGSTDKFLSLFFGESLGEVWNEQTTVVWMEHPISRSSISLAVPSLVETFVQVFIANQTERTEKLYHAAVASHDAKTEKDYPKTLAALSRLRARKLGEIQTSAAGLREKISALNFDGSRSAALVGAVKEYYADKGNVTQSVVEAKNAIEKMAQTNPQDIVKPPLSWPTLFYVPAHRVLALKNSWPRNFSDFSQSDPFVVKDFSEVLRLLLEWFRSNATSNDLLNHSGLLNNSSLKLIKESVFGDYNLKLDNKDAQLRLVLQRGSEKALPIMVWSSGQREISPLLLGLYCLVPPFAHLFKGGINWVVLEEPEIGLHPRAISAVLFAALELMSRGYRVCISTHSPHVLDMVWALRIFIEKNASPDYLLRLFGVELTPENKELAAKVLSKSVKVYYFDREAKEVEDISDLNFDSNSRAENTWGGLVDFSSRASDLVAEAVAGDELKKLGNGKKTHL